MQYMQKHTWNAQYAKAYQICNLCNNIQTYAKYAKYTKYATYAKTSNICNICKIYQICNLNICNKIPKYAINRHNMQNPTMEPLAVTQRQ